MDKATIYFGDVWLDVSYEYFPAEKPVFYDGNMTGSDGSFAFIEIRSIKWNGEDVFLNFYDKLDEIEQVVMEEISIC